MIKGSQLAGQNVAMLLCRLKGTPYKWYWQTSVNVV